VLQKYEEKTTYTKLFNKTLCTSYFLAEHHTFASPEFRVEESVWNSIETEDMATGKRNENAST